MNNKKILERAKEVLSLELEGIKSLFQVIGDDFIRAVKLLVKCKGKIIVTGLGKSGIVAKKIAATFTSTGTPALYLHPSESLHGDIGVVSYEDVVLAISKSGQTDELATLLPFFKRRGIPIISITSKKDSELAKQSEVVLVLPIEKEACSYDLVPTVSTTSAMALGDALAMVLMDVKGFKAEDFVALHPAGDIGKKFWLKVEDMMLTGKEHLPIVRENTTLKDAILEMTTKRGITSVVDEKGKVAGVITDGDLRRVLEKYDNISFLKAKDVMNKNPKIIDKDSLAFVAAKKMEYYRITALIVVNKNRVPIGIIHLHDLMRERVI